MTLNDIADALLAALALAWAASVPFTALAPNLAPIAAGTTFAAAATWLLRNTHRHRRDPA